MAQIEVGTIELNGTGYGDGMSSLIGIAVYRVGSGSYAALAYALPTLGAFAFTLYLSFRVPKDKIYYHTSQLRDIVSFGERRNRSEDPRLPNENTEDVELLAV